MKKQLLSLMALVCSMSMNAQVATTGTATRTGDINVKWVQLWEDGPRFAEYNVGAANNKAEDYGGYYCWGSSIDRDSNGAYNGGNDVLTGNNDTATNLWGDNWRMPTRTELEALFANCDVEWTTLNNVMGYKFTGKEEYSSSSMFLPANGFCDRGNVEDQDEYGRYWSSTPSGSGYAYDFDFTSSEKYVSSSSRYWGSSIRAVLAVEPGTTTAIEDVADNAINTVHGKKVIEDGKIIVIGNNGKMYNTVGIEIKK